MTKHAHKRCSEQRIMTDGEPARYSREWYVEVLEAITDLVLVKGPQSELLWANKAFREYYGMTNEALYELIDSPRSDPDDTIRYVRDDLHVVETGEPLDIPSEPVTGADGKVRHFHTIKAPIKSAEGHVVRIVGVSRRHDERTMQEAGARDRARHKTRLEHLQAFTLDIPLPVAMLDVRRRVVSSSEGWRGFFGGAVPETGVAATFEALYGTRLPIADLIDRSIREARGVRRDAMEVEGANGRAIQANLAIEPWRLADGQVGGAIVLLYDVTALKTVEQNLRRANDELTQFSYRVSHDLVGPLRTVRGLADLCEREMEKGNYAALGDLHEMIAKSADELSTLVRDLLNLARADVRGVEPEDVDLAPMLDAIVDRLSVCAEPRDLQLRKKLALPRIRAERVRVQQVLENLLSNSIKFADPEKPARFAEVSSRGEGNEAVITVRDNGVGFDEEMMDSIFEIFVRGSSRHPGNGLGLYLVRKHVRALGGTARALSNRHDTVFEIRLPLNPMVTT